MEKLDDAPIITCTYEDSEKLGKEQNVNIVI
jgi:hypothetical protein